MTATFVIEAMAAANAYHKLKLEKRNLSVSSGVQSKEHVQSETAKVIPLLKDKVSEEDCVKFSRILLIILLRVLLLMHQVMMIHYHTN